jgi:hypothetical protein
VLIVSVDNPVAGAAVTAAAGLALARAGRRVLIGDLLERKLVDRLVPPDAMSIAEVADSVPPQIPEKTGTDNNTRSIRPEARVVGSLTVARPSLAEPHAGPQWAGLAGPGALADDEVDVVLAVTSLDPARGARQLREWGDEAAVLLTAGRSTATTIGNTSEMLYEAGIVIRLAIVIGSDRTDDSLGSLPDERPKTPHLPRASISEGAMGPARR